MSINSNGRDFNQPHMKFLLFFNFVSENHAANEILYTIMRRTETGKKMSCVNRIDDAKKNFSINYYYFFFY